jgi:hypothetical protein
VIFSGFTITGAPPAGGNSYGMVAKQTVPTPAVTYTISDCKFVGTNTAANNGEFQFYAEGGPEAVVFTRNVITQYSGNGILSEVHTGPLEISYNTIDAPLCNVNPADTMFFMTYGGTNVASLQNICYNIFNMGTANLKSVAVSISAPGFGVGNAQYSNVVITGNTFNNLKASGRAIGFWATGGNNIVNSVVTKNYIIGTGAAGSYGIQFYDDGGGTTSGTQISCNTITGMAVGIYLRNPGVATDAPGTNIFNNNIFGNAFGIDWSNTAGLPVTAVNNWWGSVTGPGLPAGPGIGDPVSAKVTFNPWLLALSACAPPVHLTVISAQDSPIPGVGSNIETLGWPVKASVTSPQIVGLMYYVCTGWTGTGDVPASGTGTSVTFTITKDSTITWNWESLPLKGPSVGGEWTPITMQAVTPINTLQLLAPWVALALMAAAFAVAAYRRLLKKHW